MDKPHFRDHPNFRFVAIDDNDKIVGYGETLEEMLNDVNGNLGQASEDRDIAVYEMVAFKRLLVTRTVTLHDVDGVNRRTQ